MILRNPVYLNEDIISLIKKNESIKIELSTQPSSETIKTVQKILQLSSYKASIELTGNNDDFFSFDFLTGFGELKHIEIDFFRPVDVNFLSNQKALQKLSIRFIENERISLSFLKKLANLSALFITSPSIDVQSIKNLYHLNYLNITSDFIDFDDFENLKNLNQLIIHDASVQNASKISNLSKLKFLSLNTLNADVDYEFLKTINNVIYLKLFQLESFFVFPNMSTCSSIRRLSIKNCNKLTDLSGVTTIPNLEELAFYDLEKTPKLDYHDICKIKTLKVVYFDNKNEYNLFEKCGKNINDFVNRDFLLISKSPF